MSNVRKGVILTVRCSLVEKGQVMGAAGAAGMAVSEYVLRRCGVRAECALPAHVLAKLRPGAVEGETADVVIWKREDGRAVVVERNGYAMVQCRTLEQAKRIAKLN